MPKWADLRFAVVRSDRVELYGSTMAGGFRENKYPPLSPIAMCGIAAATAAPFVTA